MPKSIVQRQPWIDKPPPQDPRVQVDEQWFWTQPRGLDLTNRLSRVDIQYCRNIENVMFDDSSLRSRWGTEPFGPVSQDVMAIVSFVTPTGDGFLLRTTTTALERWASNVWVSVSGSVFTGTTDDHFSFTNFGTQLLIANGVDKLYFFDIESGTQGFIDESVPSKHVTMFNGRVVLSHTIEGSPKPYRVRWSVKNNSLDWTSDGSGYEDLFAAPGGVVDSAHGVYPVTDDTALIVRATSVWSMTITGNLLAPHRFTRLWAEIGTRAPRSIATIPGGIIMLSRENVVVLTLNDVRKIGDLVRHDIINSITNYNDVVGIYDYVRNEYRLAVGSTVWRFRFNEQGWTKDTYPFSIRDMARVEIDQFGLTIDELVGTIDAQVGTIDELVVPGDTVEGLFFVGT